jgi:membrane protein implicated in regulation of membrane protease activity
MKQQPTIPPGPWLIAALGCDLLGFAAIGSGVFLAWTAPIPFVMIGVGIFLIVLSTAIVIRQFLRTRQG